MNKNGVPGFENKSEEEQRKELQRILRETFSTPNGKIAFNMILSDLHFFTPTKTETETSLANYAKYLITERMGIVDTIAITDFMLQTETEDLN